MQEMVYTYEAMKQQEYRISFMLPCPVSFYKKHNLHRSSKHETGHKPPYKSDSKQKCTFTVFVKHIARRHNLRKE
jgi:hypothetical protein